MLILNSVLNQIHEWGQPKQSPMTRIGLARLGIIVCIPTETTAFASATIRFGIHLAERTKKTALDAFYCLLLCVKRQTTPLPPVSLSLSRELWMLCKRIAGLASTVILGFLSPEINFRIHLKLGLAINNLMLLKEKAQKNKLETEKKAAEIAKMRAIRLEKLHEERLNDKKITEERERIDSLLADLLLPS